MKKRPHPLLAGNVPAEPEPEAPSPWRTIRDAHPVDGVRYVVQARNRQYYVAVATDGRFRGDRHSIALHEVLRYMELPA